MSGFDPPLKFSVELRLGASDAEVLAYARAAEKRELASLSRARALAADVRSGAISQAMAVQAVRQ